MVSIDYRPDLQGLRAIAVILVILSHLGVPWVSGGFVGVDIFFVLSGFLITRLLIQEYETTGHLLWSRFYLRRLRRLLPALVVVIGATACLVINLFPKSDARLILASLPFAASWSSNLFFVFRQQNYFNELGENDLFLHTWSLGLEEQFYLLWPLVLSGIIAIAKIIHLRQTMLLLVLMSWCVSVIWSYQHPISAFYMMPARIWQFSLGGLICLYADFWKRNDISISDNVLQWLVMTGIACIIGAAVLLNNKTLYPGFWALLPSFGAALVILGGGIRQNRQIKTSLGFPALVWVGDRSYSLYLWHWPVIILMSLLGYDGEKGFQELAIVLTLLLAMISYRWIELPFWKQRLKAMPPRTFLLGSGAAVLLIMAMAFHVQRIPFANTVEPQVDLATSIRSDFPVIYQMPCDAWYRHAKVEPCVFGSNDAPNTAVLLADSIGAQWFSAWAQIFNPPQWRLVVLTKSSCAMVDEDYFYSRIGQVYEVCRQWRDEVLKQISGFTPKVIIVGNAATYDFSDEQWVEGSKRVIEKLSTVAEKVVLITGTPILGFDGPGCIAQHMSNQNTLALEDCVGKKSTKKFQHVADLLSRSVSDFSNVQVFNPTELVCPKGQCRAVLPTGIPVFRDSQHLTDTFVRSTTDQLRMQLNLSYHSHSAPLFPKN